MGVSGANASPDPGLDHVTLTIGRQQLGDVASISPFGTKSSHGISLIRGFLED